MWLFLPNCHISVVQHKDNKDLLLVRARTREDLETFLKPGRKDGVTDRMIDEIMRLREKYKGLKEIADLAESVANKMTDAFMNAFAGMNLKFNITRPPC